ncbi:MAG: NUDIX domain-containing protein [Flavobacteriales bacterium]|nr:NUDIX domain-containing protein [Flavobacteriales bacterium]
MEQRYKVFIADKPVFFQSAVEKSKKNQSGCLCISHSPNFNFEEVYEVVEHRPEISSIYFTCGDDVQGVFDMFKAHHKVVEAAGGLVINDAGAYLFIERLGYLDLPKGKLEKGETIADAALREVEEECGIDGLSIIEALPTTYHTYTHKGLRVLKPTYWFKMKSSSGAELVPQSEEGITAVMWLSAAQALARGEDMYSSIRDLFEGQMT